jgi:hypothetical protein
MIAAVAEQSRAAVPTEPDCGVCRRTLLVGEQLRVYRDRERSVNVCELCRELARKRGWESIGPVDTPRLRVQPSGGVADIVDRDALIEGMGTELAYLKEQLGAAHSALNENSINQDTVRAITDKLRRQERELERLRREEDPERRRHEQRQLVTQAAQLRELRGALAQRDKQVQMLRHAREAETDSPSMCRYGLDAFNSSEHADRMARIARTLDAPVASVEDRGPAIPRRIHITLSWEIAWYEFCVKLDLGTGKASVHQVGSGGDPRVLGAEQQTGNARWRESGLVLA